MPFRYRLEKVLKIREEELDDAIIAMREAEDHLREVSYELSITIEKRNEMHAELIKEGLAHANLYVMRIKQLNEKIASLEKELQAAQDALFKAREEVKEAKIRLEALKRHKERKYKEYTNEENRKERIMLDEIGILKHTRELLESKEGE
ncbi:MAG: flagellar FliJ family protein [Candidatus Melainabacteria bacterium]|nr:flagellar FliJ family protein [Candidatus Melainabacteria bacterium]